MHASLGTLCTSLDTLATAVLSNWADERTLQEAHGWNHPVLTRHDLAAIPQGLATRVREADLDELDPKIVKLLNDVPRKLALVASTTVPYMFNGNGHQAIPAYLGTLEWLTQLLEPVLSWAVVTNVKALPVQTARRLRNLQAEVDQININKEGLTAQIAMINDATVAAESLPADLQTLQEARERIEVLYQASTKSFSHVEEYEKTAEGASKRITAFDEHAKKIVEQCEEAYRITTTKGLAGAFDQRAKRLGWSMWMWVGGLIIALVTGAYLGAHRIDTLSTLLAGPELHWGPITIHLVLSLLSVSGPLWFAWLATKQIGQRFRLAEDYAFKASVAKAYEGYRKEANRIDPEFESRLFSSALTRLEEAPLRLVQDGGHGSPLQEIMGSEAFQKLAASVPDFRDRFIELAKHGITSISSKKIAPVPDSGVASVKAD
ncbi:MAG: hypothetical protein H7327_06705 [Herminiimonas sp.]|nr:hypothetical protein [Herminiimonas sp.]